MDWRITPIGPRAARCNGLITVTVHLIPPRRCMLGRLWSTLGRLQCAPGPPLEPGEEAIVAERPANALRGAQSFEQIGRGLDGKQIRKIGKSIPDRLQLRDAVVLVAQVRPHARPAPVLSALNQSRTHRIERYVAQRRSEMFLVHDGGAEPALPEMAAAFAPRLDDPGISSMHACKGAPQSVRIGGCEDEVHVVRHQAPGP